MKRFKVIATVVMLALVLSLALSACTPTHTVGDAGTVTIVLAPESEGGECIEYIVDLAELDGQEGLMTVLAYLKETQGLAYTEKDGGYGAYLTQVAHLAEDYASGTYLYLYTSVEADADVSEYATTIDYKGHVLSSSGVGSSSMQIEDGAIIYIGTIVYGS